MIQYSFSIINIQNFQKITSMIESNYSAIMHTDNPLPSSLSSINGSLGLSTSPEKSILYVSFFENDTEFSLIDSAKNIIYKSRPLSSIPSQIEVENLIKGEL